MKKAPLKKELLKESISGIWKRDLEALGAYDVHQSQPGISFLFNLKYHYRYVPQEGKLKSAQNIPTPSCQML